jgi:hypothetical protein
VYRRKSVWKEECVEGRGRKEDGGERNEVGNNAPYLFPGPLCHVRKM